MELSPRTQKTHLILHLVRMRGLEKVAYWSQGATPQRTTLLIL